jgi:ankyrin repeat protein
MDLNVRGREGFAAFHIAKLMLNCDRIDPNLQDSEGQRPFHWAVEKKDMELVQTLLKRQEQISISETVRARLSLRNSTKSSSATDAASLGVNH